MKRSNQNESEQEIAAAVVGLFGIAPKDEFKGIMAAQLIAAHNGSIEMLQARMIAEQTFEDRRQNLNRANKLSRTSVTLLEALNCHRGKGRHNVTVEHVHVHAGGQAVVGIVEPQGVVNPNRRINPMQSERRQVTIAKGLA